MISKKTIILLRFLMSLVFCFPVYASQQLSISLNSGNYYRGDIVSINGETSGQKVTLQINDSNNNIIFVEELSVYNGKFNTSVKLSSAAFLGKYTIIAYDNQTKKIEYFNVINKSTGGGGGSSSKPTEPLSSIKESDISKRIEQTIDGKVIEKITMSDESIKRVLNAKAEGKNIVVINLGNLDNTQNTTTNVILPKQVLESVKGLEIIITTDKATIELPQSLVDLLGQRSEDLSINITQANSSTVQEQLGNLNAEVVGNPIDINTGITGNTTLKFPLTGINLPEDVVERKRFLDSLSVFVLHSDGEKENIKGTIVYDANDFPLEMVITVNQFSTFAIIKQNPIEIALKIGGETATVNGKLVKLDTVVKLESKESRVLIPIRFVSEMLGAKVEWKENSKQVLISDREQEIMLTVGDNKVLVNNEVKTIDCPPQIDSDRVFIPLRVVSETLGAEVNYIQEISQVIIKR